MVGIPGDVERLRSAVEAMRRLWLDVGGLLASRVRERCPHRTAEDRCVYRGGCLNQRRGDPLEAVRCGGDGDLRWEAP